MTAVVNVATTVPVTFYDSAGAAATGLTVTATARKAGSTTTVSGTVTERTNGDYDVALTFTSVGLWRVTSTATIDGETAVDLTDVQVVTAAQADPAASITTLYAADFANLDAAVSSRATPANITALQAALQAGTVAVVSPIDPVTGAVTIEQGDDETLTWTDAGWPDLTGATITLTARHTITKVTTTVAGTVDVATGSGKQVSVALDHTVTAAMTRGEHALRVTATIAGEVTTLVLATLTVERGAGA